jgi:hypothetical protein
LGFEGATEHTKLSFPQMRTLVKEAGKYIPTNVKLTGMEGFDLKDVVGYSHFYGLATELLFQLVSISSPSAADIKNL